MPRLPLLLLTFALFAGAAPWSFAQQVPKGSATKGTSAVAAGEALLAPVPKGWKATTSESHQGKLRVIVRQMLPDGQSADKWKDRIAVYIWHGLSKQPIEASFDMIRKAVDENCNKPAYGQEKAGMERGYPTGIQLIVCAKTKRDGVGEALISKTIEGKDALYQIQRVWRLPPADDPNKVAFTKAMLNDGTSYLMTVHVCDMRDTQHPCPKGGK